MTDKELSAQCKWLAGQIENMSDYEFAVFFTKLYDDEMKSRNPEDYVVNPQQMRRMISTYQYFTKMAQKHNWTVSPFKIDPIKVHGEIEVDFNLMWLEEDELREFLEVMSHTNGFTIDATLDGVVHLSLMIPDIYTKR